MRALTNDAWAAGIIEGEGYIGLSKSSHHRTFQQPFVKVQMTDEDVIRRLYEHFGVGSFKKLNMDTASRRGHKQIWAWDVVSQEACYEVLTRIRPYLGNRRRARCDEVRSVLEQTTKIKALYK